MSETESKDQDPKLKAGNPSIGLCPFCNVAFQDKVPTNVKHQCPNPNCGIQFLVMVFD